MSELWSNSIELMLLGMGSVFTFLALLVVGVTIMSALINRFSPQTTHSIKTNQSKVTLAEAEVAAVAAAAWAAARTSSSNQ
ncbi:MAG: oxaloacetate decarboxylase gamma subunit, partial [Cellvibrionaceae bacterium]